MWRFVWLCIGFVITLGHAFTYLTPRSSRHLKLGFSVQIQIFLGCRCEAMEQLTRYFPDFTNSGAQVDIISANPSEPFHVFTLSFTLGKTSDGISSVNLGRRADSVKNGLRLTRDKWVRSLPVLAKDLNVLGWLLDVTGYSLISHTTYLRKQILKFLCYSIRVSLWLSFP